MNKIGSLKTESRNPRTMKLDTMDSLDLIRAIVNEEKRVVPAILKADKDLAKGVDLYVSVLQNGGRIIVTGSGCSGDYGWTDIMELPATFSQKAEGDFKKDKVFALHTQKGWYNDTRNSALNKRWLEKIEKRDPSEDSLEQVIEDLDEFNFNSKDLIIAITASGRSPALVKTAMEAKKRGGKVISIVMNDNSEIAKYSDVVIAATIGEPPLTGSGRTIAGTASKIIITTLSTAAHVRLGGAYSNLMVDLNIKEWLDNSKFIDRGTRIVESITGASFEESRRLLEEADWDIKIASIMHLKKVDKKAAKTLIQNAKGHLRQVIG